MVYHLFTPGRNRFVVGVNIPSHSQNSLRLGKKSGEATETRHSIIIPRLFVRGQIKWILSKTKKLVDSWPPYQSESLLWWEISTQFLFRLEKLVWESVHLSGGSRSWMPQSRSHQWSHCYHLWPAHDLQDGNTFQFYMVTTHKQWAEYSAREILL